MVRRLGLGKNNHLTYASLALNPRTYVFTLSIRILEPRPNVLQKNVC